jgi:hypothetical protein
MLERGLENGSADNQHMYGLRVVWKKLPSIRVLRNSSVSFKSSLAFGAAAEGAHDGSVCTATAVGRSNAASKSVEGFMYHLFLSDAKTYSVRRLGFRCPHEICADSAASKMQAMCISRCTA